MYFMRVDHYCIRSPIIRLTYIPGLAWPDPFHTGAYRLEIINAVFPVELSCQPQDEDIIHTICMLFLCLSLPQ